MVQVQKFGLVMNYFNGTSFTKKTIIIINLVKTQIARENTHAAVVKQLKYHKYNSPAMTLLTNSKQESYIHVPRADLVELCHESY